MLRNLLKISDLTKEECELIIKKAEDIKQNPQNYYDSLYKKTLLMIFEKPSLRTRVSFETGMFQMGGHAIFYSVKESPLGKKETISDTAKVASRYVDLISARLFKRQDLWDLAEHATVPVINMLDDYAHPCQILADFLTIKEKKGRLDNLKMSYFGDGYNNVTYDLMRMCAMLGLELDVACPEGKNYSPEDSVISEVKKLSETTQAKVRVVHNAIEAAKDSDIIYTDSWMSYGIPSDQEEERKKKFFPYQVTHDILNSAKSDVIFMNCLPAIRGYEQTAEVIDGEHSVVFDQAENRLHAQKSAMLFLLGKY